MSIEKLNQFPGTKWILVMDADDISRSNMRSMLEQAGYKVCLAANSEEVLDCYKEAQRCGYPFDAVIVNPCDTKGRSGQEIIRKLIECDDDVHIFTTGGVVSDVFSGNFENRGCIGVLKKPITSGSLEQTVHRAINGLHRYQ